MKKNLFYLFFVVGVLITSNFQVYAQQNISPDVGDIAPDFIGTDMKGQEHHLYDYLNDGRHVLMKVQFFTCGPCFQSQPTFNFIYGLFGCNEEDLIVLSVDVVFNDNEYEPEKYWNIIGEMPDPPSGTPQAIYSDLWAIPNIAYPAFPVITTDGGSEKIRDAYGVSWVPHIFLIGPDKKVLLTSIVNYSDGSEKIYEDPMYYNLSTTSTFWLGNEPGMTMPHSILSDYMYENYNLFAHLNPYESKMYYEDKVVTEVLYEKFDHVPYTEFCMGSDVTECDKFIPTDIVVEVDTSSSFEPKVATVSWTGSDICDSYQVLITAYSGDLNSPVENHDFFSEETTETTVNITMEPPYGQDYIAMIHCSCNDDYDVGYSEPFHINSDENFITDFTTEDCSPCGYTLELQTTNPETFPGGPSDLPWGNGEVGQSFIIKVKNGLSEKYFLTTTLQGSFELDICAGDEFDLYCVNMPPGGIFSDDFYRAKLTDAQGNVIFDDTGTKWSGGADEEVFIQSFTADCISILKPDFKSPNQVCEGGSIDFQSTSKGEIASYLWEFEGGIPSTSTEENPTITYNTAGLYDVKLTIKDANGNEESKLVNAFIAVVKQPTIVITENNPATGETESDGSIKIEIFDGVGPYSVTVTDGTNEYPADGYHIKNLPKGTYQLNATNSLAGCEANTSFEIVFDPGSGIFDNKFYTEINIFPNPVTDNLYIDFPYKATKDLNVTIYNLAGKQVLNRKGIDGGNLINVKDLPEAMYHVLVKNGKQWYRGKFVKVN